MYRNRIFSTQSVYLLIILASGAPMRTVVCAEDGPQAATKDRVNVVVFLVDDLGWSDVGCYGAEHYQTPNIDRMAERGMRFTDAYAACAVCSPTRAALMTGKYPARLHLTDFIAGHVHPYAPLQVPRWTAYLPLDEVTLAEAMKEAGYDTFFAGKWHLAHAAKYFPEHQGFDHNIGGNGSGAPWAGYFSPYRNRQLPDGPPGEYLTDRLGDEAVAFLDSVGDDPFLLFLSFYSVHVPIMGKPKLVARFERDPSLAEKHDGAHYAAMIASVDENIGKVVTKLDKLGLTEETVVLFTSDNGGLMGNEPLRSGKATPYEGGLRVPFIVKYPDVIRAGEICRTPITTTDIYPTLLDLAGLPLRPEQHQDGVSLKPLLTCSGGLDREALFWHYPHYHISKPYAAVRRGDWKLIEFYEDGRRELYDLNADLSEEKDVAPTHPEKVQELGAVLNQWRQEVGAQRMRPNPDFVLERAEEKATGEARSRWLEQHVDLGR